MDDALQHLKLIRLDKSAIGNTAVLLAMPEEDQNIDSVVDKIRSLDSEAEISFYEAKTNW